MDCSAQIIAPALRCHCRQSVSVVSPDSRAQRKERQTSETRRSAQAIEVGRELSTRSCPSQPLLQAPRPSPSRIYALTHRLSAEGAALCKQA